MLKSLARLHITGQLYVGRMLRRPEPPRRVLPIDPRRTAISRLVHLRATGAVLLNGIRSNVFGTGLRSWESKVLRWTNDVVEALEAISTDDALWFGTPDILPLISMPAPAVNFRSSDDRDRFADMFYRHAHRLARLRDLLANYGVADDQPAGAQAGSPSPAQTNGSNKLSTAPGPLTSALRESAF
jgi:hypothetical protein